MTVQQPSLIYVIGRVNQGIRREPRARLDALDLSVQEYMALSVLRSGSGLSNAQLARRSLVTPQSMLGIVAKVEQASGQAGAGDLVARVVDPGHGRILRAALTPAGAELLAQADPLIEELQERILADVSEADRQIVLRGMLSAMGKLSERRDGPG